MPDKGDVVLTYKEEDLRVYFAIKQREGLANKVIWQGIHKINGITASFTPRMTLHTEVKIHYYPPEFGLDILARALGQFGEIKETKRQTDNPRFISGINRVHSKIEATKEEMSTFSLLVILIAISPVFFSIWILQTQDGRHGDFNCVLNTSLDKKGGNPNRGTEGAIELRDIIFFLFKRFF